MDNTITECITGLQIEVGDTMTEYEHISLERAYEMLSLLLQIKRR